MTTGINKGSPLSPLLGAIYLLKMDKALGDYCGKHDLRYYQRLRRADKKMDDWLILCKTRNQLRTAVKVMNHCLNDVKQTKHPLTFNKEQTYIGKIKENGFDLLLRASCPSPFGPAKRFKMVPDHFLGYRITAKICEPPHQAI